MGHARALLAIAEEETQIQLAHRAEEEGLSVRQVERLVQAMTARRQPEAGPTRESKSPVVATDPNVTAATRELEAALGTRVRIVSQSPDRGKIEIEYFSIDELDRLYNLIVSGKN